MSLYDIPEPSLEPPDPPEPRCPVCGQYCGTIYKDLYNAIIGCDVCVSDHDAFEIPECFPEYYKED